ncbi:AmmeMemoRadiSam system protein B [candidate division KSB1 bacterium]|nr:AmmeMemoRadiSam system protein B [candidate division KSB1 bacterium]
MSMEKIHKAVVAGQFYPANAQELKKMINGFLDQVPTPSIEGEIIGLVSPHAGYIYSGQTAAYAYRQVQGHSYDAVIVIAPSHTDYIAGASIWAKGAYETPLGLAPVNETIAQAILDQDAGIQASAAGHRREHSLEVQIPFLQMTLKNLSIVPIVIQDYSWQNCQRIASGIVRAVKDKKVLLVASTDLYHGEEYAECVRMSDFTLRKIEAFEPEGLYASFEAGKSQACGAGPVVVVELIAKQLGAQKAHLLHKTNSNDAIGERGGYVVGYGAIAIYREKKPATGQKEVGIDMGLSLADKKQLLEIARKSIECAVKREPLPQFKVTSEILKEKRGAFVTLTEQGQLRGCIGYVLAYKSLYQTVSEMAQAAALEDPRFAPVQTSELKKLHLEISVLTPLQPITNIEEIEVGKHGIIIERGRQSGLLLPQVATDNNWDRTTFLEHTCSKAGLPRNTWQEPGTIIKIFSADVFSEAELK